jgi:hypothetical protein
LFIDFWNLIILGLLDFAIAVHNMLQAFIKAIVVIVHIANSLAKFMKKSSTEIHHFRTISMSVGSSNLSVQS